MTNAWTDFNDVKQTSNLIPKGTIVNPHDSLDDDRQNCGRQSKEGSGNDPDVAPFRIDDAQRHDRDYAGYDEQPAGHQATRRSVHQPADIGRELLRLWSWQKHAVVQRMRESAFRDPFFLLDNDPVHHRDLSSGTAETQASDAQPDAKGLAKRYAVARDAGTIRHRDWFGCHFSVPGLFVGQL